MTRMTLGLLAALCALLCTPALAAAQPANDGRNHAQLITQLPATPIAITTGASTEKNEAVSPCGRDTNSVWFRYDPKEPRRVLARLGGAPGLAATLTVYAIAPKRQTTESCDVSDAQGRAAVGFDVRPDRSYLIRVARRTTSPDGTFTLHIVRALRQRASLALPTGGVSGALDRVSRRTETWAVYLAAGERYRMALEQGDAQCVTATLYAPATRHTTVAARAHLTCQEPYALFVPRAGHSGVYRIVVNARHGFGDPQRYHLQLARALPDDSAPGVLVPNDSRVAASLDGAGIDLVDLYRFNVADHSRLYLHLQTRRDRRFDVELLDQAGHRLQCTCGDRGSLIVTRSLRRGRYYIAVRSIHGSRGGYRLLRASRTITHAHLALAAARVRPGQPITATVKVTPAVGGIVTFVLEQHDPLAGWLFSTVAHVRSADGQATAVFAAPSIGRWRVRAIYDGTRTAAPSPTGYHDVSVQEPLG